jgi:hypothetical protein
MGNKLATRIKCLSNLQEHLKLFMFEVFQIGDERQTGAEDDGMNQSS